MVDLTAFGVLETEIMEEALKKDNEDILSLYESLGDLKSSQVYNYGEIIKYILATSSIFQKQGMENSYFHIGGGATLLHIANTIGIENIGSWRGTHDMDIVVTNYGVRNTLKTFYSNYEEFNSFSIENKKKIELKDPQAQDSVDVDLYLPRHDKKTININGYEIPERVLNDLKTISVLGIKTRVPKLHDLLAMKLNINTDSTNLPRKKDMSDIFNLIGCIEKNEGIRKKYSTNEDLAAYIYNKLLSSNINLPQQLYNVINYSRQNKLDYIISAPSTKLINTYKHHIEDLKNED